MSRLNIRAVIGLAALLALAHPAQGELMTEEGIGHFNVVYALGEKTVLADPWWATIYIHAKDPLGASTCNGPCAEQWPPVLAAETDRPFEAFSIVKRDDGRLQWAHQGQPLYTSILDKEKGDANGHGVDDAWFVVEIAAHDM